MQLHVECVSQSMAHTTQPHIECFNLFFQFFFSSQYLCVNVPNHCGAFSHSPFMQRVRFSLLRKNRNYSVNINNTYNIPTVSERYYRRLNAKEEV